MMLLEKILDETEKTSGKHTGGSLSKNHNGIKGLCPLADGGCAAPSKYSPSPRGGLGWGQLWDATPRKETFSTSCLW